MLPFSISASTFSISFSSSLFFGKSFPSSADLFSFNLDFFLPSVPNLTSVPQVISPKVKSLGGTSPVFRLME
jgi:hypothetical protein